MARLCACHYAWVVSGVVFLTILVAGGVRSTPGLVINSLEHEFGWSRALISGAVSLNIILYGAAGPFVAVLFDTFGMRLCILVALGLMFTGIATAVVMTSAWHLYILWGVLVGIASGIIAPVLGKVVVNRWFVTHASLMMGILTSSAQTGQVLLAPLLGYIVEVSYAPSVTVDARALPSAMQRSGWRMVAWTVAGVAGAMAIPVVLFLKERPIDVGLTAYGSTLSSPVDASCAEEATQAETCQNDDLPDACATKSHHGLRHAVLAENESPYLSAPVLNPTLAADIVVPQECPYPDAESVLIETKSSTTPKPLEGNSIPDGCCELIAQETMASPSSAPSAPSAQALASPFLRPFLLLGEIAQYTDFWLLAGSFFVCGASTNGLVGVHLIPACVDAGMPAVQAAGFLGAMGAFDIVGTVASGALTDRYNPRILLAGYYAFRGAALVLLPWALELQLAGLWPFAVVYGLDWIATVPPTAALCSACFGPQRSAVAFAWCLFAHQVGAAAIAAVAGVLRTELGSYTWAFWSSGVLCVLTAAAVLCIKGRQV